MKDLQNRIYILIILLQVYLPMDGQYNFLVFKDKILKYQLVSDLTANPKIIQDIEVRGGAKVIFNGGGGIFLVHSSLGASCPAASCYKLVVVEEFGGRGLSKSDSLFEIFCSEKYFPKMRTHLRSDYKCNAKYCVFIEFGWNLSVYSLTKGWRKNIRSYEEDFGWYKVDFWGENFAMISGRYFDRKLSQGNSFVELLDLRTLKLLGHFEFPRQIGLVDLAINGNSVFVISGDENDPNSVSGYASPTPKWCHVIELKNLDNVFGSTWYQIQDFDTRIIELY